jgi:hypothetical protein
MYDPLLNALFMKIPPSGSIWPVRDRMLWLSACEATFNLVYGEADKIVISVDPAPALSASVGDISEVVTEEVSSVSSVVEDESVVEDDTACPIVPEVETIAVEPPVVVEPPPVETPAATPVTKGGRKKNQRPEGLPSNIEMVTEAITALGPASSIQIRDWLRKKYWSDLSDSWTACLWNFVTDGKLSRNGINFVLAKPKTSSLPVASGQSSLPAKLTVAQKLVVATAKPITFEHQGATVNLSSSREYVIAGKLRAAMGSGHIGESFLAENVMGRNTEDTRKTIVSLAVGMNSRLSEVGLKIEHYPGFGLIMKEA